MNRHFCAAYLGLILPVRANNSCSMQNHSLKLNTQSTTAKPDYINHLQREANTFTWRKKKHFREYGIYKLWQALLYLHPGCLTMSQLFSLFVLLFVTTQISSQIDGITIIVLSVTLRQQCKQKTRAVPALQKHAGSETQTSVCRVK